MLGAAQDFEKVGNIGCHRRTKSLVQTAVNFLSKSFSAKSVRYPMLDPILTLLCIRVQAPVLWSQTRGTTMRPTITSANFRVRASGAG